MDHTVLAWCVIATGAVFVIFRKQAARHNEWFQRLIYRTKEPLSADSLEGYAIVYAIVGVLVVIIGLLSLLGILHASD